MNRAQRKIELLKKSEEILQMYNTPMTLTRIAKKLGVSHQRIQQILSLHPDYKSRRMPLVYLNVHCSQCGAPFKISEKRIRKNQSNVFCSRFCYGKNKTKYKTKSEKYHAVWLTTKSKYHTDSEFRKKRIARSRAWLEKKKLTDPVWFRYYKGRMNIAVKKFKAKQKKNV